MAPKAPAAKGKGADRASAMKSRPRTADIASTGTVNKAKELTRKYPSFFFRVPMACERAHDFKADKLCIYTRHLKDGLALPLASFFQDFFNFFGLVPAQMAPNSIVGLRGLKRMFVKNLTWNTDNLMSFMRLSSRDPGTYFLTPADCQMFGFKGAPDSVHGWKEKFFFVTAEKGWGIPTIPRIKSGPVRTSWPKATEEVKAFYTSLKTPSLCLDVERLEIIQVEAPSNKRKVGKKASANPSSPVKRSKSTRGLKPSGSLLEAILEEGASGPSAGLRDPQEGNSSEESEASASEGEDASEDSSPPADDDVSAYLDGTCPPEDDGPEGGATGEIGASKGGGAATEAEVLEILEEEPETKEERAANEEAGEGAADGAAKERTGNEGPSSWCWTEGDICSFRFSQFDELLPAEPLVDIFYEMITSMLTSQDEARLKDMSTRDLLCYQNMQAIRSAISIRHLSTRFYGEEKELWTRVHEAEGQAAKNDRWAKLAEEELKRTLKTMEVEQKTRGAAIMKAAKLEAQLKELGMKASADRETQSLSILPSCP